MEIFGIAIFASVVLYLAVTHKGFRKVVLWTGAGCLLCAVAGGLYLWHRNRTEAAAKHAAQAADDAIQNARIAQADALHAKWDEMMKKGPIHYDFPPSFVVISRGDRIVSNRPYKPKVGDELGELYGNATLDEHNGHSLFSCDAHGLGGDILVSVPNGTRAKVLRFGYEWGTDGNYGAKIQLANGMIGCILDGSHLKLDGE